jgi:hypothetical protein
VAAELDVENLVLEIDYATLAKKLKMTERDLSSSGPLVQELKE